MQTSPTYQIETLDLFYGVLIALLTKDPTPERISLADTESLYSEEEVSIFFCSLLTHIFLGLFVEFLRDKESSHSHAKVFLHVRNAGSPSGTL